MIRFASSASSAASASCFVARIAIGAQARISAAQRRAASSAPPAGTTSLTNPSAAPSAAETRRPVSMMPIARFGPSSRISRWTPPAVAARPTLGSGSANAAFSDATIRSHANAISKPPPSARPLTAAITGLTMPKRDVSPPQPDAGSVTRAISICCFRSCPTQYARSPAPVMMASLCASSASNASKTCASSSCARASSAFSTASRAIVTTSSFPSRSARMVS